MSSLAAVPGAADLHVELPAGEGLDPEQPGAHARVGVVRRLALDALDLHLPRVLRVDRGTSLVPHGGV